MRWNKETIIQQILEFHDRKEPLFGKHIRSRYPKLFSSAGYYFRSWRNAVLAAGLDYSAITLRRNGYWTKKRVIKAIQERYANNLPLNYQCVYSENSSLCNAARKLFGKSGWRKALAKAGFDPDAIKYPTRTWDQERVLREIIQLCRDCIPLNSSYLIKHGWGTLYSQGVHLFGSWRHAVERLGLDYDSYCRKRPNGWWNKERVIREIQRCNQQGVSLSYSYVTRVRADLANAARVYWGGWGVAVEAAGFNYRDYLKRWSRKDWLCRLDDMQVHLLKNRAVVFAQDMRRK